MTPQTIFTVGHSTRPIDEFLRLLKAHGVQRVVDVRTIPRSRHNPQFNRGQLSPALHRVRIHYKHMPGAWWVVRSRLSEAREKLGEQKALTLTSEDGVLTIVGGVCQKHVGDQESAPVAAFFVSFMALLGGLIELHFLVN